jgi:putative membrane protein
MLKVFIQTAIANSIALFSLPYILSGFQIENNFWGIAVTGIALTLVNFFVKPVVKIIAFPINFATLGFFNVFINAILLYITTFLVDSVKIGGGYFKFDVFDLGLSSIYLGAVWTIIIASFIIGMINAAIKKIVF